MNEFEQQLVDKVLEGVHDIELKVAEQLGALSGDLKALKTQMEGDHKSVKDLLEKNIETDTARLNKHSEEIDKHSTEIATLKEWKDQFEKAVANRIAISNSISAIAAVIIAFLLSRFL